MCIQRMNAMTAMLIRQMTPYSRYGMIFLRVFCRFIVLVCGLCSTDGVVTATNIGRRALLVVRTCRRGLRTGPILQDWTLPLCGKAGIMAQSKLMHRAYSSIQNRITPPKTCFCSGIRLVLRNQAFAPGTYSSIRKHALQLSKQTYASVTYCDGVLPVIFLNTWLNEDLELNPESSAMARML